MSNDIDREAKTPRVSESFSFFRSVCEALAIRLERCAQEKSIPTRLHQYDRRGALRASEMAKRLREISARFKEWPDLDPETVALEKIPMTNETMALQREGETLLAAHPKTLPPRK
jgi:hypothetical protein